jgi:CRP/FNR family transcriptional regulator, cyclic AMP receptor protein
MQVTEVFRNPSNTRTVGAGETVFTIGDVGSEMYGVVSGEIELRSEHGQVHKAGEHDVFGEMALIDHAPRMATAVATQDTVLSVIDQKTFLFLVHETPMFALHVMSAMAERLRSLG